IACAADLQDILRGTRSRYRARRSRPVRATEVAGVEYDEHVGVRVDEGVDVARRLRIVGGRWVQRRRNALAIAPRIRMDARALTVSLIENRRQGHRTSDSRTLR